jgi:hypothetical protein
MKTFITITKEQLTLIIFNYEIIDEGQHFYTINIEYHHPADLFYLGCSIGIETLFQANRTSSVHSLPVVSEDKGHSQGDTTAQDKSAQGNK